MRVELSKRYRFEAAHRLPHVPEDHKCHRLHGHSFEVEVSVLGTVDERMGWLVDFDEITRVVEPILMGELDHRTLNDVAGLENATSENLARWVWEKLEPSLRSLVRITVHETCEARCEYEGR